MNPSPLASLASNREDAPRLVPRRERVWLFPKEREEPLSRNFTVQEFRCRCLASDCHWTLLHPSLLETLQTLRDMLAHPLTLSSGFRCTAHNKTVAGSPRSFHTRGMAADLLCEGPLTTDELAAAARRIPAVGGVGQYPSRGFVHLDVRPRSPAGLLVDWNG